MSIDRLLVGHVDVDGDRTAKAVRGDDLLRDLLRAFEVQVGDDDVRAAFGKQRAPRPGRSRLRRR